VTGLRTGIAAAIAAVSLALLGAPAVGEATPAAATGSQTKAAPALVVHVDLSKHRVRIGHRLRVTYSWHDGNGDLVDTNDIGTMAMRVQRNVPCQRSGSAAHPISGHGTWVYRPQVAFTGAYTHSVKIHVGFNVRTGGCAHVEDVTTTEVVTVLPAAD